MMEHRALRRRLLLVAVALFCLHVSSAYSRTAAPPLFQGFPFAAIWNVPTAVCEKDEVALDLSAFQTVTTPSTRPGQTLTLYYSEKFGLYPHVVMPTAPTTKPTLMNGGIPQSGNLTASLEKEVEQIFYSLPSPYAHGLGVVDWEDWRPMWDQNWGSKIIYRTLSIRHAFKLNPNLTSTESTKVAKAQFQIAARDFMKQSLQLATTLRPSYLWGFYLYPLCYNHAWDMKSYTGRCTKRVQDHNNDLMWLWESSTALYPSVYLPAGLTGNPNAALFVRGRVQEAIRVAALTRAAYSVPVYAYTRVVFTTQRHRFLSITDLINTIGEIAAIGASGTVIWGANADFNNKDSCSALSNYLDSTLSPYLANVTAATKLCSDLLCHGAGRCVRRNTQSNVYLHLNPDRFHISKSQGRYRATGTPDAGDIRYLRTYFTCQCYAGQKCISRTAPQIPSRPIIILI